MIPGATLWCNVCQSAPATGKLGVLDKTTKEVMDFDCCGQCFADIVSGKINWIENGLE